MTNRFKKLSLVLLFFTVATALLPSLELAVSITEIKTVLGEQRFLYIRGGSDKKIASGMIVSIYSPGDNEDKLVGRGELVEVYPKLSKVKVVELNYPISDAGYVTFGALTDEEIEQFKVEHFKFIEAKREEKRREEQERERQLRSFSILKYNGGDSLYLMPNGRVELSVGLVGLINGTDVNNGSISGGGEVEVVRLFQNAVLVRLRGGAYINSLDSVVTFFKDKKEQKSDAAVMQAENWLVSSVLSVKEEGGKLYVKACSETSLYNPYLGSTGYIYNDNMLLERAAVVRFGKNKIEIVELEGPINPHGVLLFEGSVNHDSGFVYGNVADYIPPIIGEVKEVDRLQTKTFLYVTIGKKDKGYKRGLYGYVFTDSKRTIMAGKVKVVEVYSKLSKVEVISEYEKITANSVIVVEVDPRNVTMKPD